MSNNNGKNNNVSYEAKDIYVLEGLEPVRKRPGMYIGSTGVDGLHHLVWEVVDNSIDEAMGGYANEIEVALLPSNRVRVEDNGRGIPVDIHKQTKKSALETVMCTLHAGGKFGGESYKVSGGLHGVGVSVVNALSRWMRAEVCRDGSMYIQEYARGKPKAKVQKLGKCSARGTTVFFEPDPEIFKEIRFDWDKILDHLRQQAYLTRGVKITIRDSRMVASPPESFFGVCQTGAKAKTKKKIGKEPKGDNGERSYSFFFEGGIISYVKFLNGDEEASHFNIFYVNREVENIQVETALQYTKDIQGYEMSFANNIYTAEGGMHLTGFRTALTRSLNDYARKNSYLKNSDENLTGDDVREGLTAVVSLKLREPQFEGQTKAKLGNPEARTAVETAVSYGLEEYLEKNPNDAKEILGRCILAAKARQAAKAAKETVLRRGILDGLALPGKLADCSSRNPEESELFIVEGDSAGGCWDGDTKIALIDGRDISFKELVKEYKQGKKNFCYIIQNNGHIGIAPILNPRMTKKNAKVIKIILDNGEKLVCTPDHLFRLVDGSYVSAAELTPQHSLTPLYRKISKRQGKYGLDGYEMVFDPKAKKWMYSHILADVFNLKNGVYTTTAGKHRHHVDFNKLNNSPTNIRRFSYKHHMNLHYDYIEHTLRRPDVIEKVKRTHQTKEYREKISAIMRAPAMSKLLSQRAKKQWQDEDYKNFMVGRFLEFYNSNPKYREKNKKLLLEAQKEYWSSDKNPKKNIGVAIKIKRGKQ
ncbi:MAG: DNA gyrase subunit B [Parcubacteria group bacterium LiPW_39]|nr:MAG: DNA gyrase subunit B [Parcubacteria group bacterium LiPW_39]